MVEDWKKKLNLKKKVLYKILFYNIEGYGPGLQIMHHTKTENNDNLDSMKPLPYFANSNSICDFQNCNTFNGVENNWN